MTTGAHADEGGSNAQQSARVAALVRCFERIARTSMAGLPMMNARLSVEAVGFERVPGSTPDALTGILLTPWFMNLVWLPLHVDARKCCDTSERVERAVGGQSFEFLPNVLDGVGRIESCSLFSPINEFAAQNDARNTAREILRMLRGAPLEAAASTGTTAANASSICAASQGSHLPARRRFLLGRSLASA